MISLPIASGAIRLSSRNDNVWVCVKSHGAHRFIGDMPQLNGRPTCLVIECAGDQFLSGEEFDRRQEIAARSGSP